MTRHYNRLIHSLPAIIAIIRHWRGSGPRLVQVVTICLLSAQLLLAGCGRPSEPSATPAPATVPPSSEPTDWEAPTPTAQITPVAESPLPAPPTKESGQSDTATISDTVPPMYTYEIVATYPHDRNAFTQGLLFDNGILYEGTGLYGNSTLRRVDLTTGEVEQQIALPDQYFGEGITIVGDRIYQLTWQENIGFIYDKDSFEQVGQFHYSTQGWGLTYDGSHLILSDGTPTLYFLDPETQQVIDQITVTMIDPVDQIRKSVSQINELEYINGEIYANIWRTDFIVRIAPTSGSVTAVINLSGLLPAEERVAGTDVLNGIAYLPEEQRLFVTGKNWPKLYEIKLRSVP